MNDLGYSVEETAHELGITKDDVYAELHGSPGENTTGKLWGRKLSKQWIVSPTSILGYKQARPTLYPQTPPATQQKAAEAPTQPFQYESMKVFEPAPITVELTDIETAYLRDLVLDLRRQESPFNRQGFYLNLKALLATCRVLNIPFPGEQLRRNGRYSLHYLDLSVMPKAKLEDLLYANKLAFATDVAVLVNPLQGSPRDEFVREGTRWAVRDVIVQGWATPARFERYATWKQIGRTDMLAMPAKFCRPMTQLEGWAKRHGSDA